MFAPDWIEFWTVAEMEEELAPFKFKGAGWYIEKNSTLLVIPAEEYHILRADATEKQYRVCSYDHRDAHTIFQVIAELPVLVNDKSFDSYLTRITLKNTFDTNKPPRKFDSDEETVKCSICGKDVSANTAHMHQDNWIGDECCWDERLRSSE